MCVTFIDLQAEQHVLQEHIGDTSQPSNAEELALLGETDQTPHIGGRLG